MSCGTPQVHNTWLEPKCTQCTVVDGVTMCKPLVPRCANKKVTFRQLPKFQPHVSASVNEHIRFNTGLALFTVPETSLIPTIELTQNAVIFSNTQVTITNAGNSTFQFSIFSSINGANFRVRLINTTTGMTDGEFTRSFTVGANVFSHVFNLRPGVYVFTFESLDVPAVTISGLVSLV